MSGTAIDLESISPAGLEVQGLVRRPIAWRDPVGYRRAFLDGYTPNVTGWLPTPTRERLHAMGRSPLGGQPAGTFARQILDRLLIDLSWASSRLEGNTYTRLDTENLIEFGRYAEGRDYREAQMILNHKAAIELLVEDAESIGFNRYTLQNLHTLLSEGLLADPGAGGRIRRIPVGVSGTVYEPTAIPQLIEDCFDVLLAKAAAIADPFEQSFFVMVQLPYLQPFEGVNKRVSRLAANIPLVKQNLVPLSFVDVPERTYVEGVLGVYENNREQGGHLVERLPGLSAAGAQLVELGHDPALDGSWEEWEGGADVDGDGLAEIVTTDTRAWPGWRTSPSWGWTWTWPRIGRWGWCSNRGLRRRRSSGSARPCGWGWFGAFDQRPALVAPRGLVHSVDAPPAQLRPRGHLHLGLRHR